MTDSNTIYANAIEGVEDQTQYLVYVLYRDDGVPHYVGATLNPKRPHRDSHHARQGHNVTSVEIVQEGLTLEDASILEDQMINHYGKSVDGGTLINVMHGGQGLNRNRLSEETKAKLSAIMKGRPSHKKGRKGQPSPNKGKAMSAEQKAKIAAALKGRKRKPFTEEAKANMAAATKARWAKRRAEASNK